MGITGVPSLSVNSTGGLAEASMEYIRTARRLRQLHRGNPARLHQSLRQLAAEADERAGQTSGRQLAERGTAAVLMSETEEAMDGPILRYDERSRLLRRADDLGIGRFEANLLIASVQHRRRGEADTMADTRVDEPERRWGVWNVLAFAMAVEAAAIAVGWWALLSG